MNKLTKGTIAGAAAVALLLSGGTVLAFWNDSANLGGPTTITAGNLQLTQTAAPKWQIAHQNGTLSDVTTIADVRIVPGDKLVYTGSYNVVAAGKNLAFTATVTNGSIAAVDTANTADAKLATRLAQTNTITINGVTGATATIDHPTDASGTYPVTISVELNWPFGTAGDATPFDNVAKNGRVNLSNFSVSVTQIAQP